ncbi:MAG: hypothetical protein QM760_22645 [Nibricoccus sp.]
MSYVVLVFKKVFASTSRQRANTCLRFTN